MNSLYGYLEGKQSGHFQISISYYFLFPWGSNRSLGQIQWLEQLT
jgi:hypothetical protein